LTLIAAIVKITDVTVTMKSKNDIAGLFFYRKRNMPLCLL